MVNPVVQHLPTARLVVLAVVSLFSLIALGVNGDFVRITMTQTLSAGRARIWPLETPDLFAALDVVVAVMTLVTVPIMILLDFVRPGAMMSMIVIELSWLGFLDVFWIGATAYTSSMFPPYGAVCAVTKDISYLTAACGDLQAAMAFGWMIVVILTAYLVALLTVSILSANNGRSVWKSTVKTAEFIAEKPPFGYGLPTSQHEHVPLRGPPPMQLKLAYDPASQNQNSMSAYDPPHLEYPNPYARNEYQ